MDELRQMEGERRRLNAEPLGDHAGRQPLRPAGNQQPEQREPGFLSERAEGGDRTFLIHAREFPRFNER